MVNQLSARESQIKAVSTLDTTANVSILLQMSGYCLNISCVCLDTICMCLKCRLLGYYFKSLDTNCIFLDTAFKTLYSSVICLEITLSYILRYCLISAAYIIANTPPVYCFLDTTKYTYLYILGYYLDTTTV